MDQKIFSNMDAYMDMYRYLSDSKKSRKELHQHLNTVCGKSDSTVWAQIRKADEGEIAFVKVDSQGYALDKAAFRKALDELSTELGLKNESKDAVKKKRKSEDEIPSVLSGHSPEFKQMRESINDISAMEKRYKAELSEKDEEISQLRELVNDKLDDLIVEYAKQKILILDTVKPRPEELFKKDFFREGNDDFLPVDELLEKYGGKTLSAYESEYQPEQELTTDNYLRKIFNLLFGGVLLKKRWNEDVSDSKREIHEDENDAERKRLESINEIIAMPNIPNQAKLALYASWLKDDDPEMVELLSFAGRYDINANFVIRILEKPRDYRNYRTMRGLLQQAREASEAHIKKEAALELINGEWYVEAEYKGKPCKFSMMPIDEMQEFLQLLKAHKTGKAEALLKRILTEHRTAIFYEDSEKVIVQ